MYQNCIFDLYGTLIDIRTDESGEDFWNEVADVYLSYGAKYTAKELRDSYYRIAKHETYFTQLTHPLYRHVEIELKNVFKRLYRHKGVNASENIINDTAQKFRKASTKFICLYDGVIDLLKSLKQAGKNIYLLSNAQRCFTYPELQQLGIVDYFDGILISSDCACKKPQKDFFTKLFKRYNIDKSKSIMIGNDCITDMMGANDAGIDGLYIHQEISSPLEGRELICNYKIMDGDVTKIKDYLLQS